MNNKNHNAGLGWIFKMAFRDARASKSKLVLFMASMILGIAAVVSVQSFSSALRDNIALQSKSLMGADFLIEGDTPPNTRVAEIIDSLGGADAREVTFPSMVAFPDEKGAKLVQIRGIEGRFPFYGTMETVPASAYEEYMRKGSALVDATVMQQYQLQIGDSIKIGDVRFAIAGSLKSIAGSSAIFSSVAPPVVIPESKIEATNLIQTGSRVNYKYYFNAPDMSMEELENTIGWELDQEDSDLDTHSSTSQRLGRRYENFGKFLNLIAFIALLLGCVGIASAMNIYMKEKLPSVAILKCIGASRKQTFLIYLIQVGIMGLLGGIIATIIAYFLQQVFPLIIGDLLPIDVEIHFPIQSIFLGITLGITMSILFAIYPLLSTLQISPLETLRVNEQSKSGSRKSVILVSIAILLFIFVFSFWLIANLQFSLAFVIGIVVTFAIITAVGRIFMLLIKKFFPRSWSFVPRQSLLNLFRPQNQTLVLIISIGLGTFLISTLYFTKDLLLSQATLEDQQNSPNMILLDVQSAQKDEVAQLIEAENLPVLQNIPIVTMAIQNIKGTSVSEIKADSTSKVRRWVLNHEFRTTYRDKLANSESIQDGNWVEQFNGEGEIPISISNNLADDAELKVGDKMTFNVQGVLMPVKVASIRAVDWSQMQLNFTVVFPNEVLEDAPQFSVITSKTPNEYSSAIIQRELVRNFPNISIIDLRQVLTIVEELLGKISWIINFMAFFSILTGIIVLFGAVRTSKFQRIKESVLLRTLGAKSKQILTIISLEYLFLGILGALSGILLSLIAMKLLAWQFFDAVFSPSLVPFLIIFPAIVSLVWLIGLSNSREVVVSPPLQVLRKVEN